MRTITLQVEHVDQIIIDELKDVSEQQRLYQTNGKFDRDYELIEAIQTILVYYMTAEEFNLWLDRNHDGYSRRL